MTIPFHIIHPWTAVAMIAAIVLCSTAGEVIIAAAMKSIGDLDEIRVRSGFTGAVRAVVTARSSLLASAFWRWPSFPCSSL